MLIALATNVTAMEDVFNHYPAPKMIANSCNQAINGVAKFCVGKSASTCQCKNVDFAGSFLYCAFEHVTNEKTERALLDYVEKICPNYDDERIHAIHDNATKYLVDVSKLPKFNKTKPISFPVYYNKTIYHTYSQSMLNFYNNYHYSFYYGGVLTAYFPGIFFFGGLIHWFEKLLPQKSKTVKRILQRNKLVRLMRKHVIVPAFTNNTHTAPAPYISGYFPTRMESIFIISWYILSFILHCTNYRHHISGSSSFGTKSLYLSRLIGDRSGIISTFLIILTFLLAGRNNFFLWWTGWKQSSFFSYHKAVARVCVITALIHTIAYLIYFVEGDYYAYGHVQPYWIWGSVSVVAGSVILIQALGRLRELNYEAFLYFHLILALFFLIGAWIHLVFMDYNVFMYCVAAVWGFDRFVRIVRIVYFGVRTAKITAVTNDVLEIIVPKHDYWPVYPGAFGYIYFMRTSLFWQSHPFSIISSDDGKHLLFYVKVKKGATETIMKYLQKQDGNTANMKVLFEGPYGSYHSMYNYENTLFYSSGNGIPGVYPYVKDCLENPSSQVKSIKLYWVIQTMESVEWFLKELEFLQKFEQVETIIYVTRYQVPQLTDTSSSEEVDHKSSSEKEVTNSVDFFAEQYHKLLPRVEFKIGKPCFDQLCREDVADLGGSDIGIMSCGHGAICDQIRRTVADLSGSRTTGVLDYIEELQVW